VAEKKNSSAKTTRKKVAKPKAGSNARKQRNSQSRRRPATRRKAVSPRRFLGLSRRRWSWIGSITLSLMILGLGVLLWLASELPDLEQLESYEKPPGIRVYDGKQELIGSYGHVVGKYTAYDEIPKHMIDALLATEDRRFFEHSGIDPMGIMRAMVKNMLAGGVVQGGSTLTQQLAKNAFLSPERTLKRKLQEVMLSLWIESHFSKEKIIEIYLNRVYLGAGNYGIDAASFHYFDKQATELSLQEAAMLVGLLKAPSRYAPTRDKELALKRTQQVILNMQNAGMLDEEMASQLIGSFETAIQLKQDKGDGSKYFADWVVDIIPQVIGKVDGDLQVYTTLDPKLQEKAETLLAKKMEGEGAKKKATQAALLTMTPDGAVKAMVGGVNYNESQYNRVTQAKRQPGSAFKLFVYLAALEWGMTPNSWVEDRPVRFGSWSPKNYNGRYDGEMKLREAFFRSVNTVAVQLASQVGIDKVIEMAQRLGVKEPLQPNLAISLGASEITMLELVGAFAHLANNGKRLQPYGIRKIVSQKTSEVLYERTGKEIEGYALRSNVVRMMNDLLTDTVSYGTGRGANFGRPAAGKTGTSQDSRDAWFVGFTPQYVTGVWVGNDNNSPTDKITGGGLPARIWRDAMQIAHGGRPIMSIPNHYKYDGSAMEGDVFGNGEVNLPWRPAGERGVSTDSPTKAGNALPWLNRRSKRAEPQPQVPWQNPRYQLHRGAPVSRDVQLPTSQLP
jgi:penicillin-binding protein 1A